MRHRLGVLAALLFALALGSCTGETDTVSSADQPVTLRTGTWHANITVPGGDIRFGMELSRVDDQLEVTLINGSERARVPEVSLSDDRLLLRFPAFNNEVRARVQDGKLSGTLTLVKRYGKTQAMPFVAIPGARPVAEDVVPANGDLSGRWAVTFTEPDGTQYPAVGEFRQRGNRLLGTFLTQTGDYRYLGGSVSGRNFELSTFDGAHAFLFKARADESGALTGQFWSGTEYEESWTGRRDEAAKLADPTTLTALKDGYDRFTFEFPDLGGNPVSIDDPQFEGKVILVTLAGSWCPNCHDEAAFMAEIYPRYRDQGVEIVALMFEHLEATDEAAEQVRLFREKFGIEYVTLLAGVSDKTLANEALPSLNKVLAFPTTIFIDRRGEVREIHTGFSGPGTGQHYDETRNLITGLLDTLVAEPVEAANTSALLDP
ncbi:MAG: TlpA disulfide reductase family protein [Pseudomonadota bacterium]